MHHAFINEHRDTVLLEYSRLAHVLQFGVSDLVERAACSLAHMMW